MADECDMTDSVEEPLMELQIKTIRNRGRELEPEGYCIWCDEPFPKGSPKLFCDSRCAMDHERYNRR